METLYTSENIKNLNTKGFTIIDNVLPLELAEETAQDLNLDMDNTGDAKDVFQKLFNTLCYYLIHNRMKKVILISLLAIGFSLSVSAQKKECKSKSDTCALIQGSSKKLAEEGKNLDYVGLNDRLIKSIK